MHNAHARTYSSNIRVGFFVYFFSFIRLNSLSESLKNPMSKWLQSQMNGKQTHTAIRWNCFEYMLVFEIFVCIVFVRSSSWLHSILHHEQQMNCFFWLDLVLNSKKIIIKKTDNIKRLRSSPSSSVQLCLCVSQVNYTTIESANTQWKKRCNYINNFNFSNSSNIFDHNSAIMQEWRSIKISPFVT